MSLAARAPAHISTPVFSRIAFPLGRVAADVHYCSTEGPQNELVPFPIARLRMFYATGVGFLFTTRYLRSKNPSDHGNLID